MSTVLTKPVLLDETGQAIVGKLDEIKEAIDNGGTEKYPVLIHITSMPTKTNYIAGEQLNLAGIVVKAVFSNNVEYDVTDQCTFSPANGTVLTSSDTSVTATYTWHPTQTSFTANQPISVKSLESIAVTTPPTQTEYNVGDALDLSGMIVTATYDDATTEDVTSLCVYSPADGDNLTPDDEEITISLTVGNVTKTTTQAIVVNAIFGVYWDGTAPSAFSRTDGAENFTNPNPYYSGMSETPSSPFDNIMPWAGMERVEDAAAGTLVKIPKFYYKWTISGSTMKLQISPKNQEGFSVSPAHMDRGDGQGERDFVYVGAYACATDTYKSTSGVLPKKQYTRANFRTSISALAADVWQWDYAMYWTICMLYLVEFADWNVQTKIGGGCSSDGSTVVNNGQTDSIAYHTGSTGSSHSAYGYVKYRGIENLWANVLNYLDGVYFSANQMYITKNPSAFAQNTGGVSVGISKRENKSGTIKKLNKASSTDYPWVFFPDTNEFSTLGTEYICDNVEVGAYGSESLAVGATPQQTTSYGLFQVEVRYDVSANSYGSRLMKLPANA